MSTTNPFAIAQAQLDKCAEIIHLDPAIHAILRMPKREIHVSIPVRMDDGSIRVFPVSYTHLDVYKRQELKGAQLIEGFIAEDPLFAAPSRGKNGGGYHIQEKSPARDAGTSDNAPSIISSQRG